MNLKVKSLPLKILTLLTKLTFTTLFTLFGLTSCFQEEKAPPPEIILDRYERISGEVQVLNGTNLNGMAGTVRSFLMDKGFDVIDVGNADEQNFDETLIVYRNPDWSGKRHLENSLKNPKTMILENSSKLVDVTIFIGKDIQERIYD